MKDFILYISMLLKRNKGSGSGCVGSGVNLSYGVKKHVHCVAYF